MEHAVKLTQVLVETSIILMLKTSSNQLRTCFVAYSALPKAQEMLNARTRHHRHRILKILES